MTLKTWAETLNYVYGIKKQAIIIVSILRVLHGLVEKYSLRP
jgi:hypothetical protein